MLEEGAVGLKAFLVDSGAEDFRRVTDGILMEAMKMAAEYDFPIMVHAESEELNCFYTEKYKTSTDWADWSDMHPEAGELAAVAKCLIFAEAVGARLSYCTYQQCQDSRDNTRGKEKRGKSHM